MLFKNSNLLNNLIYRCLNNFCFISEIIKVNFFYKFITRRKRILQCTTYSLKNPDHGGKLRSFYIRKSLRKSYDVETLSFEWKTHEFLKSFDVRLNMKYTKKDIALLGDILISDYIQRNSYVFKELAKKIFDFSPNIILLEQPYIWPLIERCMKDNIISKNTKVIYSSHNIEIKMKEDIYKCYFSDIDVNKYSNIIEKMEQGVISNCSSAFAVSSNDVEFITDSYPNKKVKIFKNGSLTPKLNRFNVVSNIKWISKFRKNKKNWVFISSWHPPNIEGLFTLIKIISKQNQIVEENFTLWVLGDVGNGIKDKLKENKIEIYPWLKILGHVSSDDINQSIIYSSGIILPIWKGGGSNLKTSQALLSGKCVLASRPSLRSFEEFDSEDGVFIANSNHEMSKLMFTVYPKNKYKRSIYIESLDWSSILNDLPNFVRS